MKRFTLVLTTINVPTIASELQRNFKRFDRHCDVIIIGDRKTPDRETRRLLKKIPGGNANVKYLGPTEQERWLADFRQLARTIPYNSDNRRNIGYLMALQDGADVVISIDDDNFPIANEDFIAAHSIVPERRTIKTVSSSSGWFNICSMLSNDMGANIYPRGFPYSARFANESYTFRSTSANVAVNLGLWVRSPDVDAVTSLSIPAKITGFKKNAEKRLLLAKGTWSPIDSQNTAIARRAMPAYYFVSMDCSINGMKLDRYGDIWQGYFIKKVAETIGDGVCVGAPLTDHNRNPHNYLKDLKSELWGTLLNENVLNWLRGVDVRSKSYSDSYIKLSELMHRDRSKIAEGNRSFEDYLSRLSAYMRTWIDACDRVM